MLKKRLIPKLLIKNSDLAGDTVPILITTRCFRGQVKVGNPISQAKIYEAQLADELIVLNLNKSHLGLDVIFLNLVTQLARETFMPLTVGGGVRELDDFGRLLDRGADKVSINTIALEHPELITKAASHYGTQCVVVSIDFRTSSVGSALVVTNSAQNTTGLRVVDWSVEAVARGAGEILLCDADRDGSGAGLNCAVGLAVATEVGVPVILSGGCGTSEHFVRGFIDGKSEGVAAGTFFCLRDQNLMQTRSHIDNAGVAIRMGKQ